jgi:SAM-dependent methyltransferase
VRAFDALAADYDASFTATPLGTLLREAVWRRLDARFSPGNRVLELACGTGEDAVHLARRGVRVMATDASGAMVETARRKVAAAGLEGMVEVRQMDLEELVAADGNADGSAAAPPRVETRGYQWLSFQDRGDTQSPSVPQGQPFPSPGFQPGAAAGRQPATAALHGPFDGAFSDFGGLNCVADLPALAQALAQRLRPGAPVLLCVMGPLVPWEWIWYLGKGDPARAFRRLRRGGVAWRGLTVRYPSIRALRRAFAPEFRSVRVGAVGVLLPPTYVEEWTRRHPRLLAALARWERRLERVPPLPWLADHYLVELERRAA